MTLRVSATPQQYKTCSKCRLSKPVSMFSAHKGTCKRCCNEFHRRKKYYKQPSYQKWNREYKKRPHVAAKAKEKRRAIYGFTQEKINAALDLQQNRCGICKSPFKEKIVARADHCH